MHQIKRFISHGIASVALVFTSLSLAAESSAEVVGLWRYTGLVASSGQDLPLTGVFLFADGKFLQQAIFDGEPYAQQGAMAHSGTYTPDKEGVDLFAGQTLSLAPGGEKPLTNAGITEHDLTATTDGQSLTLVFGSGTVQTFDLIGRAEDARVYTLAKGMLAFAEDYFVLVTGDGDTAVTGYGAYRQEGERLWLDVIRWSEGANGLAQNLRDVTLSARFDGSVLALADGRTFPVLH